jgi:methylated-DNA-[protein]-cysteine S-methyltransferase
MVTSLKTRVGDLHLIAHEHILLAAGFTSVDELFVRLDQIDRDLKKTEVKSIPIISDLINDYFDGDLAALGGIKVRQPGSEFSQAVWKAMRKIPVGSTMSYSDLAMRAGSPKAVRAVGSVCARNLIAPIVPCHRVVKTGGDLGNYAFGIDFKENLLRHEGALQ